MLALPRTAEAQRGVALGVGAGLDVPDGREGIDFDLGYNWGFFVDIPLISTFHITPSTLVRKINGVYDTDVGLAFKFVVPLGVIEPYGAVLAGLTAGGGHLNPHLGLAGGANFWLIANLGVFAQLNYKLILYDDPVGNVRDLQIYVGPVFQF